MAQITQKLSTFDEALTTLKDSIELFNTFEKIITKTPTKENERIFLAARDSMIQRFEYCTDLLWKVLKVYLEDIEKIELTTVSPRGVIRETVKVKTITEQEGEMCIDMVKNRNETSHIYHEEVAQNIAQKIPSFYQLMHTIIRKVQEKMSENNKRQ